ncbi:MAG: hypothetical protein AMS25_12810 [Gemmatimonas sp. SM23_52]|nr:MAG: hypothetical protein AMS25_12810 [Gemmatimonas sp. SM23_52]
MEGPRRRAWAPPQTSSDPSCLAPRYPARPQPALDLLILASAVLLRYLFGLAVELFTLRTSMLAAAAGVVVFFLGLRQLLHRWLPVLLVALSIPLPAIVLNLLALPLQQKAAQLGSARVRGPGCWDRRDPLVLGLCRQLRPAEPRQDDPFAEELSRFLRPGLPE